MHHDGSLLNALVDKAQGYRDTVPVFQVQLQRAAEWEREATKLALRFAALHGMEAPRYSIVRGHDRTKIRLPEGAGLQLFNVSGAMMLERGWSAFEHVISNDTGQVDREVLNRQVEEGVQHLELDRSRGREELRFERLWQLKAAGMTRERERGPVALTRVVGAFRRYLYDLPVWGRASVFVKVAAEGQVDSAGIDWRPVSQNPIDQARVLDPKDAAKRTLDELSVYLPGGQFTLEDYAPEFFSLGYFSLPKRRVQAVMQPVWVAMFRGRGPTTLNRLLVVPGATKIYEPIGRIVQAPPADVIKPEPNMMEIR